MLMPHVTRHQSIHRPLTVTQPASIKTLSLPELITRAQGDDMPAMEELIKRIQKQVYVTLYQLAPERDDIGDLTQDVLLKVCRSLKTLRTPETFKYWLNRIVVNRYYDELRKRSRQLSTVSMDDSYYDESSDTASETRDIADLTNMPEKRLLGTELDEVINQAIAGLPEQFRTVIVLREMQGLSYDEIAALMQTNIGTVKSRLARARQKLQELVSPYLAGQSS